MEYIQTNIYIMHELLEEGGGCFSHEQCLVALLFCIRIRIHGVSDGWMDGWVEGNCVCMCVCMFNG